MGKSRVRQSLSRVRRLRPGRIRKEAQKPFRLMLEGADERDREALSRVFLPEELNPEQRARGLAVVSESTRNGEPVVRVCTPAVLAAGTLVARRGSKGVPIVVDWSDPLPGLTVLLQTHSDLRLSLARTFLPLREILAHELIRAVAGRNAALAAISALPEVIPTPLSLLLALGEMGSDTVLLTANQMALAFELAALRGEEVGWRAQSGPLFGVLAAAVGWRTLARELVGLIPGGLGLAAKASIAYAGSIAVGQALWRWPQAQVKADVPPQARMFELESRRKSA